MARPRKLLSRVDYDCMTVKLPVAWRGGEGRAEAIVEEAEDEETARRKGEQQRGERCMTASFSTTIVTSFR